MAKHIAYYRVRSGPGKNRDGALATQREDVKRFVATNGELVEEFTEDEAEHQRRKPHFEAALTSAKRHHATLIIPRFRPIHRTAAFVDRLANEDVDFVALDMPGANQATIASLVAAAAQHRRMVSERIRTSLRLAQDRGRRLGNPEIARARPRATQAASEVAQGKRQVLREVLRELRARGLSLRAIAHELNSRGIPSARGRAWYASSVRKILVEAGDPIA